MGEQYHYLTVVDGGYEFPGPTSSAMPLAGNCQTLGGCFNKITMAREDGYLNPVDCEGGWYDQEPDPDYSKKFNANAAGAENRIWFIPATGTNYGPGSWAYNRFGYGLVVDDPYHIPHTLPINAYPLPSPNSCLP